MQSWSLEQKIKTTQAKIIEFGDTYSNKIYVSFSGGKDSTVLLDLVRRVYPDTPAVFIDTGLEYPEIRDFVKTIPNVTWLKPEMNFKQVIQTYGYPIISKEVSKRVYWARRYINEHGRVGEWAYKSLTEPTFTKDGKRSPYDKHKYGFLIDAPFKMSDKCCLVMKKETAHRYDKTTGRKPILATMTEESQMRKKCMVA